MSHLGIADFDKYFFELHTCEPYDWQRRLAERAISGDWPPAIDLPTGAGKTACIDIAVFALACQASESGSERTAPLRLFFCVNRRVIVDEACQRSQAIAKAIWNAERDVDSEKPVLRAVAAVLRNLAQTEAGSDVPPLDVLELRGGIYRDNRWARSPIQPTVVCTTIDQLGSRLLFRGYGVSPNAAPIQAALIAYDSLILLDEAHISRPFLQTLQNVRQYLDPEKWAEQSIGVTPVVIVPMTATPPEGVAREDVIRLEDADRENEALDNRLTASKPAKLSVVPNIVSAALAEAKRLAKGEPKTVGVIVNRVATARAIHDELRQRPDAAVELVIGSMRPIDRDEQSKRLQELVGSKRRSTSGEISFVVSTQCLEVGADYDFDVLLTECASLDALRQRFGRLNRGGRPIEAEAVILMEKRSIKAENKLKEDKPEDPIYGNALTRTWNWLSDHSTDEQVDFGVDAFNSLLREYGEDERIPGKLLAPSALLDAPVMLPAYVDFWCQTSPRPAPDPDVSLFLHGSEQDRADVQVCWRGDLVADDHMQPQKHWCDVVALLPPTSSECMSVSLSRVRRWLAGDEAGDTEGDLLGVFPRQEENGSSQDRGRGTRTPLRHGVVVWRGTNDSGLLQSPQDLQRLRPGDTLVLPETTGGWNELGHVPRLNENGEAEDERIDVAELASLAARDRVALRVHRSLSPPPALAELLSRDDDRQIPATYAAWRQAIAAAYEAMPDNASHAGEPLRQLLDSGFTYELYPDNQGVVFTARRRLGSAQDWFPSLDDGDDSTSRIARQDPVRLAAHAKHVVGSLNGLLAVLQFTDLSEAFCQAATVHDLGKADDRFQAMLKREARTDAWLCPEGGLLAKSDGMPQTQRDRHDARRRAGVPDGFRHEMLSMQLATKTAGLPEAQLLRHLTLHLIAAHHGYARPFAPAVIDDDPPDIDVEGISVSSEERLKSPAHRLDSGVADRFWGLTRHFGWWGLAYLESVLRLADQQASAAEDLGELDDTAKEDRP